MSCKTCGHTMHKLGTEDTVDFFWCPRCGSIKRTGWGGFEEPPKLVERCREFIAEMGDDVKHSRGFFPVDVKKVWHRLGIGESILPPEQRSQS